MNWTCPHCEHKVTITSDRSSWNQHVCSKGEQLYAISSTFYVCPNKECQQVTLHVSYGPAQDGTHRSELVPGKYQTQRLIPAARGRPFPNYIPAPIIEDYNEACAIRELSPKASATLSRRCLQGILRDFWKVKPANLVNEIKQLEERIEPEVWDAIDGVRKIGNIGAHMEKDINQIIEVDPDEAGVLIELIEMLLDEWYVARHVRAQRLGRIRSIADDKDPPKLAAEE